MPIESVSFLFRTKSRQNRERVLYYNCNISEYMTSYCFWIRSGPSAAGFRVANKEETIGLKSQGDIIHLGILKYQGMSVDDHFYLANWRLNNLVGCQIPHGAQQASQNDDYPMGYMHVVMMLQHVV